MVPCPTVAPKGLNSLLRITDFYLTIDCNISRILSSAGYPMTVTTLVKLGVCLVCGIFTTYAILALDSYLPLLSFATGAAMGVIVTQN